MAGKRMVGALVGWRRSESEHGIVLLMQLAATGDDARNLDFDRVTLALNDRQLRSLARDLQRAADQRGLDLWGRRKRSLLSRILAR